MLLRCDRKTKRELVFTVLLAVFVSFIFIRCSYSADICFSEEGASKLVVELEQCINMKEQIELLKQKAAEEEKQIVLLKEKSTLQNDQLKVANDTVEKWKGAAEEQKKICEDQKPGFFNQLFKGIQFVGFGVLIGAIGVLLL